MKRYLSLSMLLVLATVHLFPGGWDDSVALVHAVTGTHFLGYPYGNSLGFHWLLKIAYPVFGHHLDLYRLAVILPGLLAFLWLDCAAESKWATLGLAVLLWMPITWESFHMLRYDTLQLALIALTAYWMVDSRDPVFGFFLGVCAGLCPFISMSGVLIIPATFLTLLFQRNIRVASAWMIGTMMAGIVFMRYFPADQFVEALTLMHNLVPHFGAPLHPAGILMLAHPWACGKAFALSLGFNQSGNGSECDLFYVAMVVLCVRSFRDRILSRFALFYALSHFLFCMSRYPVLIEPLLLAAGLSAI